MENDENGAKEQSGETEGLIEEQIKETIYRFTRNRFPNFDQADQPQKEEMMKVATDGLCKFASLDVLYNLFQKHKDIFSRMGIITSEDADQSSPLNTGKAEPIQTHSYFLIQDNSGFFAASPANNMSGNDSGYAFEILKSDHLIPLLSKFKKGTGPISLLLLILIL